MHTGYIYELETKEVITVITGPDEESVLEASNEYGDEYAMTYDAIMIIDKELWADTWTDIKSRIKDPGKQLETGWLLAISENIESPSDQDNCVTYELSQYETLSGLPEHVDIPITYVM